MILSGVLHTSLSGFTVIRGVARLGDLERCSESNPEYQRNLIDTHKKEIGDFLASGHNLFFPEIILSALLQFNFNISKDRGVINPIQDIQDGRGFASNVNGLSVWVKAVETETMDNGYFETENEDLETEDEVQALRIAHLKLPDQEIKKGLKLFRIDGNHRLSAAKDFEKGSVMYDLPTPFCIVLHEDSTAAGRFEKVVFHNINSKQIPLTSEENLKLILHEGEGALFSDNDLLAESSLGPSYLMARKLTLKFDAGFLTGLANLFENRYTLALSLTQFFIAKDKGFENIDVSNLDSQVSRLRDALKMVNAIYEKQNHNHFRKSCSQSLLVAFAYFALKNNGKQLSAFTHWIKDNRIDRLASTSGSRALNDYYHSGLSPALDAATLVEVFESFLSARCRKVFVSMEFSTNTDSVYNAIETAIKEVNRKHALQKVDLALIPIRIDHMNEGHSFTITDKILQIIDGCGLLIADLTQSNKNVYHEIGFLMGLNQGREEPHENFIFIVDEKQAEDTTIGFNLRQWQQIRFTDTLGLTNALVNALEKHYGLKGEELIDRKSY